jgi:hypothetical protein
MEIGISNINVRAIGYISVQVRKVWESGGLNFES